MNPPSAELGAKPVSAWHDSAIVVLCTLLSLLLSAHFELSEAFFRVSRRWERWQLDEWPVMLLVLTLGLMWLAWRRYRQARGALQARAVAEAQLAEVLHENRLLAQEHLRIQELERKHLARELHDQLGQYLNAIKLDAVSIRDSDGEDAALARQAAAAIVECVDTVHGSVSDMIGRLRPVALDELGLLAAIEHCLDQSRQRLPRTQFALNVQGDFDDLDETLALTVYRVIQEGLTNIGKHAQASSADVELERERGQLRIRIRDDGRGLPPAARPQRFGLSGMRERVELAGGRFSVSSTPQAGVCLEAWLPLAS